MQNFLYVPPTNGCSPEREHSKAFLSFIFFQSFDLLWFFYIDLMGSCFFSEHPVWCVFLFLRVCGHWNCTKKGLISSRVFFPSIVLSGIWNHFTILSHCAGSVIEISGWWGVAELVWGHCHCCCHAHTHYTWLTVHILAALLRLFSVMELDMVVSMLFWDGVLWNWFIYSVDWREGCDNPGMSTAQDTRLDNWLFDDYIQLVSSISSSMYTVVFPESAYQTWAVVWGEWGITSSRDLVTLLVCTLIHTPRSLSSTVRYSRK